MKIRSSHVILVVLLALAGFIALAVTMQHKTPQDTGDDFLASVHKEAAVGTQGKAGGQTGSLPPANADVSDVAVLEPETTEFYMGTVRNDGPTTKDTTLYNRGKEALRITDVRTTCGCTIGSVDSTEIPPGGQIPLHVTIDPWRIPGFHSVKTLTVYSTDPVNSFVKINVTADVEPEFSITPDEVDFGKITKGEPAEQKIHIAELQDLEKPLVITEAKVFPPDLGINATLTPVPEAQWATASKPEFTVDLQVSPDAPVGPINAALTINTNQDRVKFTRLTVKGEVTSFYTVAYHLDTMKNIQPGQTAEGAYELVADRPISVEQLQVPYEDLTVTSRPGADADTLWIDVKVDGDAKPGFRNGQIIAHLKADGKSLIEKLPLRAVVTRPRPAMEALPLNESEGSPADSGPETAE